MLRPAVAADLLRLLSIRDAAGADALCDPARVNAETLARMIGAGAATVWDEDGTVAGFYAADAGSCRIAALLVGTAARGKGIGRALLAAACETLERAGCTEAAIAVIAGGEAVRHYRAAGWIEAAAGPAAEGDREFVLKKPL